MTSTSDRTWLCVKHGGSPDDMHQGDAFWLCDVCKSAGLVACRCGGKASVFGEAMMSSVSCSSCDEHVMFVGYMSELHKKHGVLGIREAWNAGLRGDL